MINPDSLMLGNYILFNNKEIIVTPEIFKIFGNSCKRKLFSPIEISKDWLIEFGFEKIETGFVKSILFESFFINNDFLLWFGNEFNKEIEYVHQLQNILYLFTNEKLTK